MPSPAARGYARTGIGDLHYLQVGAGPFLLLLPQSGRSYGMFGGLVEALKADFTILTADLPGSGNSDPLPPGAGYREIAAAYGELLARLGASRTHVYGIHTGNKIATALAANWPDRVDRVVLAGQSHSVIPDRRTRNDAVLAHMRGLIDVDPADAAGMLRLWSDAFGRLTAHWWRPETVGTVGSSATRAVAIARIVEELQAFEGKPRLYAENLAYDFGADLARVKAPVLFIEIATDVEDREVGRQAAALQAAIGRCRVVTFQEPDGFALTLENRVADVAREVKAFLTDTA